MNGVNSHFICRQSMLRMGFDLALLLLPMLVVFFFLTDRIELLLPQAGTSMLSVAAGLCVANTASGFYQRNSNFTVQQACVRAGLSLLLVLPLTYLAFGLLPPTLENRFAIQTAAMAGAGAVVLRRLYVTLWAAEPGPGRRVLIFGAGPAAQAVGAVLESSDPDARIVGYVPGPQQKEPVVGAERLLPAGAKSLIETARRHEVDEIVVALTERRSGGLPMRQLLECKLCGIQVHDIATHFEKTLGQIRIDYVNDGWLVFGNGFNHGLARASVKRGFDLLCATLLLALAWPVMLVTALLIKLESRGPLLYRQERVGQHGRTFLVNKFRSMRIDAEKDGCPVWATAGDGRVTRVGAVIRMLRIDELPQLFNVLQGEMSLVGPRPERPYFVELLGAQIPYFAARHSVKPGVTGWAQVRYPYGSTVEDARNKLEYDLYYLKNQSLLLDVAILMETVFVVLTARGAR